MKDIRYSKDHIWVENNDNRYKVGITDYLRESLNEIVFVDLEDKIKQKIIKDEELLNIESSKVAFDLIAPLDAIIIDFNKDLIKNPSLLNKEDVIILEIEIENKNQYDQLLDKEAYFNYIRDM